LRVVSSDRGECSHRRIVGDASLFGAASDLSPGPNLKSHLRPVALTVVAGISRPMAMK
jgi:hypothetical protein